MSMPQPTGPQLTDPHLVVQLSTPLIDPPMEIDRVRAATYLGRDPDNLVTTVIDSDGMVVTIKFATTIAWREPATVEGAIRAAIAAAHSQLAHAWLELTSHLGDAGPSPKNVSADFDAPHGGVELAYDEAEEDRGEDR